ncbi:MAG: hypothetical protein ACRDQT_02270, partial [Gaiellaceae bacterium]
STPGRRRLCSRTPLQSSSSSPCRSRRVSPEFELFYWRECPSYPEAKALLEQTLEERGIRVPIEMREVWTQEEAIELAFPGSQVKWRS